MLLASDIHFNKNRKEDVAAFVAAAGDPTLNPDRVVVIPGDFTLKGRQAEYSAAQRLLNDLVDAGSIVVTTPGNHDFGKWPGERLSVNDAARAGFRALLRRVNAQQQVIAHEDFDTITLVGADLFVALRSTHRGKKKKLGLFGHNRIRSKQLTWAATVLESIDLSGLRLHFVTHRSLWEHHGDKHGDMDERERLENRLLREFGFSSFLHGHNHRFHAAICRSPRLDLRLIHVSVPTLSERNEEHPRGYVRWDVASGETPQFVPVPSAASTRG